MRIIGGKLRGRSITPPPEYKARPTTDFAKEGLFNILDNEYEFEGLSVLDLFGGAGSISFEFASRGAASVHCIEMNPDNARFIKQHVHALGLDKVITVVHHNVFDFLPLCRKRFDLVFADPPYALDGVESLPDKIFSTVWMGEDDQAQALLYPDCYFILEHSSEQNFSGHPRFCKEKKYGAVHFSFFR